jgi:toxin ParE1/3/4
MTYSFHPAAEAEYLEQIAFYADRHRSLGVRYRQHFLRVIERVCETPV